MDKNEIVELHEKIKPDIEKRLKEFTRIWKNADECALFIELAFCILTPQSKARTCWRAIENLVAGDILFQGNYDKINKELNIVRFKNNKTSYLIEAREKFLRRNKGESLRENISRRYKNICDAREWLVKEVKGYGYKEASHFLRNIGFGADIAILDRHILRNLKLFNVLENIPASISGKKYCDIENRMKSFSEKLGIPLAHLDFVLWYKETGDIFK